jgi:hypothetical protein
MQTNFKSSNIDEAKIVRALEALPEYRKSKYSKFHDDMIIKYVPTKGTKEVSKILGMSRTAVYDRFRLLKGIRKNA